jgi:methylenetetrahydrofolate reductase (NADPH)
VATPPKGSGGFTPHPEGFSGSVDLIEALARHRQASPSASVPTRKSTPTATDQQADVDHLKRKIDAGRQPRHDPVLL